MVASRLVGAAVLVLLLGTLCAWDPTLRPETATCIRAQVPHFFRAFQVTPSTLGFDFSSLLFALI